MLSVLTVVGENGAGGKSWPLDFCISEQGKNKRKRCVSRKKKKNPLSETVSINGVWRLKGMDGG